MNDDLHWPSLADTLFPDDDQLPWRTHLASWTRNDWNGYANGYKDAVDALIEVALDRGSSPEELLFPVVFLYRHYTEVRLKQIIFDAHTLLGIPLTEVPATHSLRHLWVIARPLLAQVWPSGDADTLNAAEKTVTEFDSYDPTSMVFRYPVDRHGRAHTASGRPVDLAHFSRVLGNLSAFLEGCISGISTYLDSQTQR